LVRIYTRTGDGGVTGRIGGSRVPKDSPYIEACGALDELNALFGFIRSFQMPDKVDRVLQSVQDDLFTIGAEIATPQGLDRADRGIQDEDVRTLEKEIDDFEAYLTPLKKFILPGGAVQGAALHLARTVVRRAERRCISLSRIENVDPLIIRYLNRLSDLCFVMARIANLEHSIPEKHPSFGNKRD
jgi:cob(I)alamin adenosyltransferase